MKKILLASLVLLFAINSYAQDFKFGAQVGLVVANSHIANKPDIEGESRRIYPIYGFNANIYIGYRAKGKIGLSMEPGYIQKGGVDNEVKVQLNYLQLPILFDYYFSEKLFVSIGPELAYLVNAKWNTRVATNRVLN